MRNYTFEREKEGAELDKENLDCNAELAEPLLVQWRIQGRGQLSTRGGLHIVLAAYVLLSH